MFIVLGLLLFTFSLPLTIMNESAAVTSYLSHGEGLGQVEELSTSGSLKSTASSYQNSLVHLISKTFPNSPTIRDPDFGITVDQAFSLKRKVEMLQWVEYDRQANVPSSVASSVASSSSLSTDKSVSEGRYYYTLEWREDFVSSTTYHDRSKRNSFLPIRSETFVPADGLVCIPNPQSTLKFMLSAADISKFVRPHDFFPVNDEMLQMAGVDGSGVSILSSGNDKRKVGGAAALAAKKMLRRSNFEIHDGLLYTKGATRSGAAADADADADADATGTTTITGSEIGNAGEIRISYLVSPMSKGLSIIAGVDATGTLISYELLTGKRVMFVRTGMLTASQMFRHADFENNLRMSMLRLLSFLLSFFGFMFLLEPASFMLKDAPVVGSCLTTATIVGVCRSSLMGAAMTQSLMVGVIWLRSNLSVGLLALMFAPISMLVMRSWARQSEVYGKISYTQVPSGDQSAVEDEVEFGLD